MWAHENHPNEYFTAKQVKEVRLYNGKGSRIPKRWRWRLFHELSAYSGTKEPAEEGEGRNTRSAKVVHRLGRAPKGTSTMYGCKQCNRLLCLTRCYNKHVSGKCEHKRTLANREWES
jgi:hypothetical protein